MTTALVTGGTSGIGAAFARALAARGDDLVLVARDADRLRSTAAELQRSHGITVEALAADLAVREDVERVAQRLAEVERPVDLLVNNAGFGIRSRLVSADLSAFEQGYEVMVHALMVLSAAAGRAMTDRGHGAIVNVGSTAAYTTMGSYAALKAFVGVYTEALANELRGTGVTATVLAPGWVRTEFHERADIGTGKIPAALWLNADDLVAECLRDVAAGRVLSIPSRRYQALIWAARLAPRVLVRRASVLLSSGRH
ncbi:SDR family NAD(P)-dependent oxidoreductase [uncultured Friedmanniella sp.]|uniref:SDR family NAD(P)-dependent oxidoreductase n=1 Tax=uncultured Friedmanniella sp. TaxID=335381 RepID=UPI0035CA681A